MAAFKIVIAERIVITAFKVARTVAFRLIALCGIGSISGFKYIVMYPTTLNRDSYIVALPFHTYRILGIMVKR